MVLNKAETMRKAITCLVLKALLLVIFSGWVSIWILRPTKFWTKLWLRLERKTSTPAFGYTGPDIFLYSFPLILLAALGAIYLQAHRYQDLSLAKKKVRVKLSRRLIFIRGPLGFVSAAELLTIVIFVGLMGWTLYSYVSNDFSRISPKKVLKSGNHHIWQYKLAKFGTRLGYIGNLCLAVLFLPVTRGLDLLQMIGVHFEMSVKYHIWLGNTMMVIYTLHGVCFSVVWGSRNSLIKELTRWDRTGPANLPGGIALLSGMIMWLTSIKPIRRKFFELFYYTHHLYVVFIVFFALHTNDRHFCTVLSGIFLFLLDRFLRFLQSGRTVKILSARILPCKAVELTLSRHPGLKYVSTSVILLKIPVISRLQWHPFSITSSSSVDKDRISVMIKCQGEWTERLYNFIYASHISKIRDVSLSASVEGPYGPDSNYFLRYDSLLLIAGGSGVTPFLSILQEIMSQQLNSTPRVLLIVVVKKREDLSMLNAISPTLLHQSGLQSEGFLNVEAFVTQEEAPDYESPTPNYEFKAVQFETEGINSTIPALLGTESKLWRASLIFTTFVVFLILLGLLNSLFVYPKDHNSYNIYPSWGRRLFINLALAMGICITVCAMSIWKWKTCMKLIANGHGHSAVKLDEGRQELPIWEDPGCTDCLSLLHLDNVHYGRRPDFQGIFSTCAKEKFGSNVGVLVSGPQGMQESVASVCRQHCSFTNNSTIAFNFHSISFCL